MKFINLYILLLILFVDFSNGKDLQILNFKSKRDLNKYMKRISKDLGVKCSFCHDMNDKSIDTKNKLIAIEMIKMQQQINKILFSELTDSIYQNHEKQVSCWTCHRGQKKPEFIQLTK